MAEDTAVYEASQKAAIEFLNTPKPVDDWRIRAAFDVIAQVADGERVNERALGTTRQTLYDLEQYALWLRQEHEELAARVAELEDARVGQLVACRRALPQLLRFCNAQGEPVDAEHLRAITELRAVIDGGEGEGDA